MSVILQPVVGYGWSEQAGDFILNAAEEAIARRRSRSPFWRACMERATHDAPPARPPQHGPPTWTITGPAEAAGEHYFNPNTLHARTDALHRAGHATVSYQNVL